jgi:hypothetical protein
LSLIVGDIDVSRRYALEEIMEMYYAGRLKAVADAGYIVRSDFDHPGQVLFVPASESTLFRMPGHNTDTGKWEDSKMKTHVFPNLAEDMRKDVEREHPMKRRSGQQKRLSLVKRLLASAKQYGTIPGLTDEQISAMIGEKWKTGVSIVTEDMVARVSAYYLGQGEATNKAADSKRTTKAHPLA